MWRVGGVAAVLGLALGFAPCRALAGGGQVAIAGHGGMLPLHLDFTGTPIGTGAWTQIVASTPAAISAVHIDSTCSSTLYFAVGPAGSELKQLIISRGADFDYPLAIPKGSRIALEGLSGTCAANDMDLTFYGN